MVEVGEVDANSPFTTLLLYQDQIDEPFRIMSLLNKVGSEQSVDFLVEGLASLHIYHPRLLLHYFDPRIDRKSVADDGWINSWHICGGPGGHLFGDYEASEVLFFLILF